MTTSAPEPRVLNNLGSAVCAIVRRVAALACH